MSNIPSTPLAEGVAALRAQVAAVPAPAWVPEAIHALILALLLRLFGRLEDMIALWQAGHPIPLPAPRAPRNTTGRQPPPPRPPSLRGAPRTPSRPYSVPPEPPAAAIAPPRPTRLAVATPNPWQSGDDAHPLFRAPRPARARSARLSTLSLFCHPSAPLRRAT